MRQLETRSNLTKHMLMHTHESTLYTQHASCIHTSAAAPSNGHDLADCAFARAGCRRSQLHSVRRQPTTASEHLQVRGDLVLHCAKPRVLRQRSTCLQATGSTESVPHKDESADTKRYAHQSQTVAPVFMSDSVVSFTELIAAGHCVDVPQVVELRRHACCGPTHGQALGQCVI
jgi:hypothetical protein